MDTGHKWTDRELAALEERIATVYRRAYKDIGRTIRDYFDKFAARDDEQRARLDAGEITNAEYTRWRLTQMGRGERYKALQERVAERMYSANTVALAYVNDTTPGIYTLNRNWTAYTIEQAGANASFTLWDESTVRRLIVEQPQLMPNYPKAQAVRRGIDLAYSKRQIGSAVTSGILQGHSVGQIAAEVQRHVTDMSWTSATRAARTAVTAAQNGGRQDTYEAAQRMGIELKKEWVATLDNRTRHAHAMADGQVVAVDKPFKLDGYDLMFPGDKSAPGYLVYNCRCTTIAAFKDYGKDAQRRSIDGVSEDMTYQEWAEKKEAEDATAWNTYTKKSRNLSADTKQWQEYKSVLGNEIPNTVEKFQNLKYNEPEKWAQLKAVKQQTVVVKNAECITTPRKYTGYFLKEGAKHAAQFFDVGYTAENPLQLRYDMARQFDIGKATDWEELNGGAIKFNIYMELGVTKKRTFLTGWIQDAPESKPRIVTSFRKNKEGQQ